MTCTCRNAQAVGAVIVAIAVASIALGLDVGLGGIFTTQFDRLAELFVVSSKLIEKASHSQFSTVSIIEVRMRHLQTHINDAQQDALASISIGQTGVFIDGRGIDPLGRNVHQHLTAHVVLNALHPFVINHRLQLADGYISDVNVANVCDSFATVFAHHSLGAAIEANHGAHRFMLFDAWSPKHLRGRLIYQQADVV